MVGLLSASSPGQGQILKSWGEKAGTFWVPSELLWSMTGSSCPVLAGMAPCSLPHRPVLASCGYQLPGFPLSFFATVMYENKDAICFKEIR